MKYIVYLTINLINKKQYIGVHKTEDPEIFDYYLGAGVYANKPSSYQNMPDPFPRAVTKYGPSNFYRTTLKVFDKREDAQDLERWLVDQAYVQRTDTYNIALGGDIPPDPSKAIYQYNLSGILIKEWKSIKSITDFYNVNKDRIRMVINDKRSFERSYWSEIKQEKLDLKEYRPSSRGSIRQYTKQGVLLHTFKNTTEAAKALDIDREKITNAIYGKYATGECYFLKENETIESYLDGSIKKEKPIYQYNKQGVFIKEFNSFKDIKKELKLNKCDLQRAIKNNGIFKEFYWSHFKYTNILEEEPELHRPTQRKVYQYTLSGELVKVWDSINECKKLYPSVLQVCLGKRNHCKNFIFSFDDKLKIQSDTLSNER